MIIYITPYIAMVNTVVNFFSLIAIHAIGIIIKKLSIPKISRPSVSILPVLSYNAPNAGEHTELKYPPAL